MVDLPAPLPPAADLSADVLVVGGGPAGAAAATEGARRGLDVIVVDKAAFPRDKCCGDGLTTGALRHLEALGLDPSTVESWRPIEDVTVRTPSGRHCRFPLPGHDGERGPAGLFAAVARRAELDHALLAVGRGAGATVLEGHELTAVGQHGTGVSATVIGHDVELSIEARYLIAADGMWSPTRKLLGRAVPGYRGDWHAFRQYFVNVSGQASRDLLVWFEPDLLPGYAWSFPVGSHAANVGFGIQRRSGRSVQVMKSLWPEILSRPHVVEALGPGAVAEGSHRAWPIPAKLGGLPMTDGRVLFAGDALGAADPMTGEGIGQALETGRAALAAVAERWTDPDAVTARYRSELERGMRNDHRMASALSAVLASRLGVEAAVAIAGATGWTRGNFARWLFEDYPRALLLTPRRWRRGRLSSTGPYRNLTTTVDLD